MTLTNGEKLILVMLCEIYKKLDIKDSEIDSEFVMTTLFNGQHWGFDWQYGELLSAKGADDKTVTETCDILDMWSFMETSYERLSPTDQKCVQDSFGGENVKFPGFDANNDPHYGVASYFIKHMERFQHFKDHYLNSHSQHMPGYLRMYAKFEPIRKDLGNRGLSADELIDILNARRHPKP